MLATQVVLDHLAGRIERAYGLRRPDWWGGCLTARVWFAAAERLWGAHATDPTGVPLDAELFVASQPIADRYSDPWSELAQPESARRYRSQLRRIVRRLRSELNREVSRAERLMRRGSEICEVLGAEGKISPLGCLIVALRAGRADLAGRFTAGAVAQHRSCPLYQRASIALLPADLYPVESLAGSHETLSQPRAEKVLLSLN